MAREIERKFLVKGDFRPYSSRKSGIIQGYLSSVPGRSVRIRIKDDQGFITIKGMADESGISRFEWEKEISLSDAFELLKLCEPGTIDKTRYYVRSGDHTIEVDVFHGGNEGLIIAEIELGQADEVFKKPEWLGEEVSGDPRYYNSSLKNHPYGKWRTIEPFLQSE